MRRSVQFKIATEADEFEEIHRLNYRAFAEEIPQHPRNSERRRVDRFHAENTYVIARDKDRVVGMLALRGRRPFSLDQKLPDLDAYLPPGRNLCEIRLLVVESEYRGGWVFRGLLRRLTEEFIRLNHDLALVSATVRQLRLYTHLGFVPFGPLTGQGAATFQPMYLTLESYLERARAVFQGNPANVPKPALAEVADDRFAPGKSSR